MSQSSSLQGFLIELLTFADFGVLFEDADGIIQYTNPKLLEIFEIPSMDDSVIGHNCMDLAERVKAYWVDPDHFIERVAYLKQSDEVVRNEHLRSIYGKVVSRDLIPVRIDGTLHGRLWLYTDITSKVKSEDDLKASRHQLTAITETMLHYINSGDSRLSLPILLDYILTSTQSEYGFIGEVLYDEHNRPYLKSHAITNIAWNEETRKHYDQFVSDGLEFRNLDTLFGQTLTGQKVYIANDPKNDPKSGGIPHGHPAMNTYIGIPFFKNDRMMGMMGLANKPGGYTMSDVEGVKPYLITASSIIENFRHEVERKKIQKELVEREQRWRLAIEGTLEGIWDLDFRTMETFFSDYFKSFFVDDNSEFGGFETILDRIDASDRIRLVKLYSKLRKGQITDFILNGELRLPEPKGGFKWLQWRCAVLRDDNGSVIRLTGSMIDITKKKMADEEIMVALQKQENLNQLRQRFVTMASHEFKSPLTSIQTSSDLIEMVLDKEDNDSVQKISKYTNRIRQQVKRLNNILSDILVLGRLEANQLKIKQEWIAISTLITDVQEHLSHLIDDDRTLVVESTVESDRILVDINLMMHLLSNLVSNAFKYSAGRPAPVIRFSIRENELEIEVEDFGIGMNEKDRNNMFEPFYRSDNASTIKGYGLGLVLVKEIVDVHSGTVTVKSELDKGTTICVRIPQPTKP